MVVATMRLLVDAHWWVDGPPSNRNVLRSLVTEWLRAFPADDLTLRVPKNDVSHVEGGIQRLQLRADVDHYPRWARYHAAAVATIAAPRREYDAVLAQNFCPPFSGAPRFVLLHDAIFATNPEWFTKKELLYLRGVRPSLRRATTVLVTSQSEAARIGFVWPELRERLVQVGLSVPTGIVKARAKRPSMWNGAVPFVLTVSRLNVRKNLDRLIEAFARVARQDPSRHLVVAGKEDGKYSPSAIPDHVASRIHFLGYVTDDELRWLYENCDLFVFPSLDEGYGLPLIEANMLGAAAIASDIPVFRELEVAADYFDPRSVDEMATAILLGLGSPTTTAGATGMTWQDVVQNIRRAVEMGRVLK
jgi:glycosyltransferase involved in cell wall biosynthesis